MKTIVGRPINGISLNGLEYLLDNDGNEILFDNEIKAKEFLKGKGFTDNDIYYLTFQEINI